MEAGYLENMFALVAFIVRVLMITAIVLSEQSAGIRVWSKTRPQRGAALLVVFPRPVKIFEQRK